MKKSIIGGTIATIVGGLVVMMFQHYFFGNEAKVKSPASSPIPRVEISLNGSNNGLSISNGGSMGITSSLNILGSNLTKEVSVSQNQTVSLRIIGSNNDVSIDKSIFPNISVSEIGSNNNVSKSVW